MADDEGNPEGDDEMVTMSREAYEDSVAEAVKAAFEEARDGEADGEGRTVDFNLIDERTLEDGDETPDYSRQYAVRHDAHDLSITDEDFLRAEGEGENLTVEVGEPRDMQGYTGACIQTYKLIQARASRDYEEQHRLIQRMERAGMYDDYRQKQGTTDNQGVPFLPTAIADRIDAIREEVGVARQLATVFNITEGTIRVPGVQGVIDVSAVNENSDIPGKGFSTENVDLDPEKWGGIHPFSTEMNEEVGAQYVDNVVEAAGIGFAKAEDETVFTADGTASYHGITGLLNDGDINEHTLPSGSTSFTDLTYDDWLQGVEQISPSLYEEVRTFYNPYLQFTFHRFEDNGGHIFPFGTELPDIVEWTEALPGADSDAADTSFGVAGDLSYIHMAVLRDVTVDMLREGTVEDEDGNNVNLALQDMLALRFTARWDVDRNNLSDNAFSKYTTASS